MARRRWSSGSAPSRRPTSPRPTRRSSPRSARRPPAVHRFPGSMAARMQELARIVEEEYDGRAERLWAEAGDAQELNRRLLALPGFGKQKARIFVALLAKQLGVRPDGWEQVAGDYAEDGYRSVADVDRPRLPAEGAGLQEAEEGRGQGQGVGASAPSRWAVGSASHRVGVPRYPAPVCDRACSLVCGPEWVGRCGRTHATRAGPRVRPDSPLHAGRRRFARVLRRPPSNPSRASQLTARSCTAGTGHGRPTSGRPPFLTAATTCPSHHAGAQEAEEGRGQGPVSHSARMPEPHGARGRMTARLLTSPGFAAPQMPV